MTSKERVRAALARKPVDKIPAGFTAVGKVYESLYEKYGFTNYSQLAEKFDLDIFYTNPRYIGPELPTRYDENGNLVSMTYWGCEKTAHDTGKEIYQTNSWYPLSLDNTLEEIENFKFPNPDWFDYSPITECCNANPDKAILIGHPGPFQVITNVMNMEDLFILMLEEPDTAKKLLNNLVEFEMEYYRRSFAAGGGKVDFIHTCDDYGTQISMLFSVDMWKDFFRDNTKRLVDLAHENNAFFQQHSCGAIAPLIPEFIKCGIDSLDPVQKVTGLEVERLKELYEGQITFHGGIDTQFLLPNGNPEEVKEEVKKFMKTLGENSGYILMGSQGYETDIPLENIEAIYSVPRDLSLI
ncbi:MAG: uroporphyrinogen decarboxylase family protein [Clostridia bacterium]